MSRAKGNQTKPATEANVSARSMKSPKPPTWEFITPERAKQLLRDRAKNRPINTSNVENICRALRAKQFLPTHQGIALRASDGRMFDGQNRCMAIVITDIGAWMWVFSEVPDASMIAFDTGKSRSAGTVLELTYEIPGGARLKALVAMLHYLNTGAHSTITAQETVAVMDYAHAIFQWNAQFPRYDKFGIAPVAAACMYAYPTAPAEVSAFRKALHSGVNLTAGSPVLALRNVLVKTRASHTGERAELSRCTAAAIDKYIANESCVRLRTLDLANVRSLFGNAWDEAYGSWPIRQVTIDRSAVVAKIRAIEDVEA